MHTDTLNAKHPTTNKDSPTGGANEPSKKPRRSVSHWITPMWFSRLDFYIIFELIRPMVGGILFLTFVFLMFQLLRLAEFLIVHGIPIEILAKMVGYLSLSFLPSALPFAFLIGIIVVFGRLSSDSELVAAKASGFSVLRLSMPVFFLATIIVVLSLRLNLYWVPKGERKFKILQNQVANTKVVSSLKEGTFTTGFFDLLIYTDKVNGEKNTLERVFIFDERDPKTPLVVAAKEGRFVSNESLRAKGQISPPLLELKNGNIHWNDSTAATYSKIDFGSYRLILNFDETEAAGPSFKPRMFTLPELEVMIAREEPKARYRLELEADLWRRIALAISPLIFVFLGIGFGATPMRAVKSGGAIITLIVVAVYWPGTLMGSLWAQQGRIPAAIAMQLPNAVIFLIGLIKYLKSLY